MFSKEVYRASAPKDFVLLKLDKDGSNKSDFFITETLAQKKFAQNYGGYPRSDIALINEQNNISVARAMLEQLTDYGSSQVTNADLSDTQIRESLQSKYSQSPSEVLPIILYQL